MLSTTADTIGADNQIPKHVALYDAIKSLNQITHNLEVLIDKVQGPSPEARDANKCPEPVPPSLHELLCNGPMMVHESTNTMQDRINKLAELLF